MNILTASIRAAGSGQGTDVDLSGSWSAFWRALPGGVSNLLNLLAIVGVALVAIAFIKWAWDRRRGMGGGFGGGGGSQGIVGAVIVGIVLAAPNLVIPAVLSVLDLLIDAVVSIWQNEGL